jgi:pimeloyl-ACP methyl ester carboxylesterase
VPVVRANAIDIEYEAIGPRNGSPMVLIMGLGMQLTAWPDEFCQGLAHRGFRVIRFDNRDTGLSTKTPPLGPLKATAMLAGATLRLPVRARYGLNDMARDAVGLMDALDIDRAHVVGASMGGMIAQLVVDERQSHAARTEPARVAGPAATARAPQFRTRNCRNHRVSAADRQPRVPNQRR